MLSTWIVRFVLFVYGYIYHLKISASHASVSATSGTTKNPSWQLIFSVFNYSYADAECEVTILRLDVALPIFPHISRLTGIKSLADVALYNFRVHIYTSERTPRWLERLRRSLVFTVLNASTERLDDIETSVVFKDPDGNSRVIAHTKGWYINNQYNRRFYKFVEIDAVMRRKWETDFGDLELLAQDCHWYLLPPSDEEVDRKGWLQIVKRFLLFLPKVVPKLIDNPLNIVDLYVSRVDVTFETFRLWDAELVKQGGAMLEVQLNKARGKDFFQAFTWDIFMDGLVKMCS